MNQETIERAARAIRDTVRISIRPDGGTMELLEQGHTFHLNQEEATKAAKAAHVALHPTITTAEELDAVPAGAVVRSTQGTIACRHWDKVHGVVFGDDRPFPWKRLDLPATILHMGGAA